MLYFDILILLLQKTSSPFLKLVPVLTYLWPQSLLPVPICFITTRRHDKIVNPKKPSNPMARIGATLYFLSSGGDWSSRGLRRSFKGPRQKYRPTYIRTTGGWRLRLRRPAFSSAHQTVVTIREYKWVFPLQHSRSQTPDDLISHLLDTLVLDTCGL